MADFGISGVGRSGFANAVLGGKETRFTPWAELPGLFGNHTECRIG
jgi:hypothetical protein